MMLFHAHLQITEPLRLLLLTLALSSLNCLLGCLLSCHTCQENLAESLI